MAGLTCHLFNSEPSLPLLCTSGAPFTSLEHSFDPFKAEYDSSGSSYKVQHETDIFLIYLMDGYWYMAGPKSKTISYINISGKGGGIVLQVCQGDSGPQPSHPNSLGFHCISSALLSTWLTERRPKEHCVQSLQLQLLPMAPVCHLQHSPCHGGVGYSEPVEAKSRCSSFLPAKPRRILVKLPTFSRNTSMTLSSWWLLPSAF